MTGYTPIFSKIVDSSLWCEPDNVVKIFLTMLAKKDADNVVRGSAFNISQWAKKTEQEVLEALMVLSAPDTRRIEPQPFEGRRIERVEEGWMILNGKFYQDLMRSVNRREYKARHEAERRARLRGDRGDVSEGYMERERRYVKAEVKGDQKQADLIAAEPVPEVSKKWVKPTVEECKLLAVKSGLVEDQGIHFYDYYESNGWRVGKNPMRSTAGAMANWKRNYDERRYEQSHNKNGGPSGSKSFTKTQDNKTYDTKNF